MIQKEAGNYRKYQTAKKIKSDFAKTLLPVGFDDLESKCGRIEMVFFPSKNQYDATN